MLRQEFGLRETVLGKEHPDALASMNNLAGVLRDQGIKTIRRYRISFGVSARRTIARGCEAYWPSLLGFD
jgi:hypothetical protein